MRNAGIFVLLCVFFGGVYSFHLYAIEHTLYFQYPLLDIPMHTLGGFGLGLGGLWLYYLSGLFIVKDEHRSLRYTWFLAVATALVLGGIWEVYEYGMDIYYTRTYLYNIYDTLSDFFFDAVGGTIAAAVFIISKSLFQNHDRSA